MAVGEDKADAAILKLMGEADLTTSNSFITQYTEQVDAKFEAKCNGCGSTDVNRMSAKPAEGEEPKELTNAELRAKLIKAKQKTSPILVEDNK